MSAHRNARASKGRELLTPEAMEKILRRVLPRKNQKPPTNYHELIVEARDFGIRTRAQFRALMLRHRRSLIATNQEPLTAIDERLYRADLGDAEGSELLRLQAWFSWEAMTRLALEFEFGEKYSDYLDLRYPSKDCETRKADRSSSN